MCKKISNLILLLTAFGLQCGCATKPVKNAVGEDVMTYTLGPLHLDRTYISMTGPVAQADIDPPKTGDDIWIRSMKVDIEDEDGKPQPLEFLCHAWLTPARHRHSPLLTISQGMAENAFPEGFAVRQQAPYHTKSLHLMAQALNNQGAIDKTLKYKVTLTYLDDTEAARRHIHELKVLKVAVRMESNTAVHRVLKAPAVPSRASHATHDKSAHEHQHGHEGEDDEQALYEDYPEDPVHFSVPPGEHEFSSSITNPRFLHGGVIHFIKLHLHPYGRTITLKDVTTGDVLWTGQAENENDRAAIRHTDDYSSSAGIRIDPNHSYRIVTVYNNTTDHPVDAMAVLRVYVAER